MIITSSYYGAELPPYFVNPITEPNTATDASASSMTQFVSYSWAETQSTLSTQTHSITNISGSFIYPPTGGGIAGGDGQVTVVKDSFTASDSETGVTTNQTQRYFQYGSHNGYLSNIGVQKAIYEVTDYSYTYTTGTIVLIEPTSNNNGYGTTTIASSSFGTVSPATYSIYTESWSDSAYDPTSSSYWTYSFSQDSTLPVTLVTTEIELDTNVSYTTVATADLAVPPATDKSTYTTTSLNTRASQTILQGTIYTAPAGFSGATSDCGTVSELIIDVSNYSVGYDYVKTGSSVETYSESNVSASTVVSDTEQWFHVSPPDSTWEPFTQSFVTDVSYSYITSGTRVNETFTAVETTHYLISPPMADFSGNNYGLVFEGTTYGNYYSTDTSVSGSDSTITSTTTSYNSASPQLSVYQLGTVSGASSDNGNYYMTLEPRSSTYSNSDTTDSNSVLTSTWHDYNFSSIHPRVMDVVSSTKYFTSNATFYSTTESTSTTNSITTATDTSISTTTTTTYGITGDTSTADTVDTTGWFDANYSGHWTLAAVLAQNWNGVAFDHSVIPTVVAGGQTWTASFSNAGNYDDGEWRVRVITNSSDSALSSSTVITIDDTAFTSTFSVSNDANIVFQPLVTVSPPIINLTWSEATAWYSDGAPSAFYTSATSFYWADSYYF